MNKKRDVKKIPLKYFVDQKWLLDVYVIRYNDDEVIDDELSFEIINDCLRVLESKCLSEEFEYFKTGMAFLHFGRRGIDLSVWHIGIWGSTYEYFSSTWYCYERNYKNMELLDDAEPRISQYEINMLAKELLSINDLLLVNMSASDFRKLFTSR